ncbi:MAG: hypothetical protein VXX85_06930 [Candidatus Margulisiibacteriota bacterium]|nr:hypothetical protein [Candidatus Margulisiibacteriota bacterium]
MGKDSQQIGKCCSQENSPTGISDRPSDSDPLGTTDGESPLSIKDDCSTISDLSSVSFTPKPSVQFKGDQLGEEFIDQLEIFRIDARPIDAQQNPFETDNLIERLLYYDAWTNDRDPDFSQLGRLQCDEFFNDFLQHYSQYSSQRDFNLSYLLSAFSNLKLTQKPFRLVSLIKNNDVNAKELNQYIQSCLSNDQLVSKPLLIDSIKLFEASKVRLENRLIEYLCTKVNLAMQSAGLTKKTEKFKRMKRLIELTKTRGYGERPSFDFFNRFNDLKKRLAFELSGYFYEKMCVYSKGAHFFKPTEYIDYLVSFDRSSKQQRPALCFMLSKDYPSFKGYSSLAEYQEALNQNTLENEQV